MSTGRILGILSNILTHTAIFFYIQEKRSVILRELMKNKIIYCLCSLFVFAFTNLYCVEGKNWLTNDKHWVGKLDEHTILFIPNVICKLDFMKLLLNEDNKIIQALVIDGSTKLIIKADVENDELQEESIQVIHAHKRHTDKYKPIYLAGRRWLKEFVEAYKDIDQVPKLNSMKEKLSLLVSTAQSFDNEFDDTPDCRWWQETEIELLVKK